MKLTQLILLAIITIALSPIQTDSGLLAQSAFDGRARFIQGIGRANEYGRAEYEKSINEKISENIMKHSPQDPTDVLLEEERIEREKFMVTQKENVLRGNAWSFGSTLSLFTNLIAKRLATGSTTRLDKIIEDAELRLCGILRFFDADETLVVLLPLAENTRELVMLQIELMKKLITDLIDHEHEASADIATLSVAAHNLKHLKNCGLGNRVVAEFQDIVRYRASELAITLPEVEAFLNPGTRDFDRLELLALTSVPSYELRDVAVEHYKQGNYAEAKEPLTRMLQSGYEISSTRLHLARIALMTDDLPTTRRQVDIAWKHRKQAASHVLPRILWIKLALSLLDDGRTDRPKVQKLFGQINAALKAEDSRMEWTMAPVLEHLRPKLPAEAYTLLATLVDELSKDTTNEENSQSI